MENNYHQVKVFEYIYLEDSYVLGIDEQKNTVVFDMEFVLFESHDLYQPPKVNEQYCYTKGKIIFSNIENIRWIKRNFQPNFDINGDVDYGNIDMFWIDVANAHLIGEWGEVVIVSAYPKIFLKNDDGLS